MHYSLRVAGLRHTSVCYVSRYTDLVGCVLIPVGQGALWPVLWRFRGHPLQDITFLGETSLIPRHLRRSYLGGMLTGSRHFSSRRPSLGQGLAPDPLNKGLVPYHSSWWDVRQILTTPKMNGAYALLSGRCWAWTHFGRQRFDDARIWSGVLARLAVGRRAPWRASSSFRGPSSRL